MSQAPDISLNVGWTCDYFEPEIARLYEFLETYDVPTLSMWRYSQRFAEGWSAWLQRRFTLIAHDVCINYLLVIAAAPQGTVLFLNQRDFGVIETPATLDVTDYVTLDDNHIAFRVPNGATGTFNGVRLIGVPCP